jgi:hypothetical protein
MSRFLHPKLCETDRFRRFVCDLCIDRGQKQISGLRTCQNRGRTPARREIPWHTWSDPGHFCCGVSPSLLQIHRFAVECLRFSLEIPQGTPVCFTMTRTPTANNLRLHQIEKLHFRLFAQLCEFSEILESPNTISPNDTLWKEVISRVWWQDRNT